MDIIIYGSLHGAAKRYADGLAASTGINVLDYKKAKNLDAYKRVIYIGSIYAGGVTGLKKTIARLVPGQEFFLPDDPGDRVIGEELLLELTVLINIEFDTVAGQLAINISCTCQQFVKIHHIGTFLLSYKTIDSLFDNTKKKAYFIKLKTPLLYKKRILYVRIVVNSE